MEFSSQYLMFLHQGWSTPVVFSCALAKENETPGHLELCPLLQLGWSEWKSLELPK
jgi:hypothetical protein